MSAPGTAVAIADPVIEGEFREIPPPRTLTRTERVQRQRTDGPHVSDRAILLAEGIERIGPLINAGGAFRALHQEALEHYERRFGYPYRENDPRFPCPNCGMCSDTTIFWTGRGEGAIGYPCECRTGSAGATQWPPFDPAAARIPASLRRRYTTWGPQNNQDAYECGIEWISRWPARPTFLTFFGPTDAGKSQLAAELAARTYERHHVRVMWYGATEIKLRFQATYGHQWSEDDPGESALDILEELARWPLLVIDDLGAAAITKDAEEKLFALINLRHEREMPTICTANDDSAGLTGLHERIHRRILENSYAMVSRGRAS